MGVGPGWCEWGLGRPALVSARSIGWGVGGRGGGPGTSGEAGRSYYCPIDPSLSITHVDTASTSMDHTPPPPPSKRLLFSLSGDPESGRTCPGHPREAPGVIPSLDPGRSGPALGLTGWAGPKTASKAARRQPQTGQNPIHLVHVVGLKRSASQPLPPTYLIVN